MAYTRTYRGSNRRKTAGRRPTNSRRSNSPSARYAGKSRSGNSRRAGYGVQVLRLVIEGASANPAARPLSVNIPTGGTSSTGKRRSRF